MEKMFMKTGFGVLLTFICLVSANLPAQELSDSQEETGCRELLLTHLSRNFDDIHDVSMRYHHLDHRLNGLITFDMVWTEGRLRSFTVLKNETGNRDFVSEFGAAMKKWYVEAMPDACKFVFSLQIKIVGSDDPSFYEKSIFTGEVVDTEGYPVNHARVGLSRVSSREESVPDGRTSREGVFVRTLIPPGIWVVTISCPGFEDTVLEGQEFLAGEHKRAKIVLEKDKSNHE
jgi:Carboxypeptidase regulatory-like domain